MTSKPSELRERARAHRTEADRETDATRRHACVTLAVEYEKLADEIERLESNGRRA